MKKPFKETKLGKWLKEKAPKVADVVGDILPNAGVFGMIKRVIDKDDSVPPEHKLEFERMKNEFEKEILELEIKDRESARTREVELAKAGRTDHLMYVAGYVSMISFIIMIMAILFLPEITKDNPLFHQLMGIIEGVALTVFGYYFGASKIRKQGQET